MYVYIEYTYLPQDDIWVCQIFIFCILMLSLAVKGAALCVHQARQNCQLKVFLHIRFNTFFPSKLPIFSQQAVKTVNFVISYQMPSMYFNGCFFKRQFYSQIAVFIPFFPKKCIVFINLYRIELLIYLCFEETCCFHQCGIGRLFSSLLKE